MTASLAWTPLDPAENPTLSISMADAVAKQGGSALASAAVVVSVLTGLDPTPQALVPGGICAVANGIVSCQKTANTGVNGTSYLFTFTAITAAGKTIVGTASLLIQKGGN